VSRSDSVGSDGQLSVGLQKSAYARDVDVFRQVEVALHRRLRRASLELVDVRRLDDQLASVQLDDDVVGGVRLTDLEQQVESTAPRRLVPLEHRSVQRRRRGCRGQR